MRFKECWYDIFKLYYMSNMDGYAQQISYDLSCTPQIGPKQQI